MSTPACSIAVVLDDHLNLGGRHTWECSCSVSAQDERDRTHAEHQAEVWREACTIRTVEQLDTLNRCADSLTGPLIKSNGVQINDDTGTTGLGGVLEGNGDGTWNDYDGGRDLTSDQVALPALLLWHPGWSGQ